MSNTTKVPDSRCLRLPGFQILVSNTAGVLHHHVTVPGFKDHSDDVVQKVCGLDDGGRWGVGHKGGDLAQRAIWVLDDLRHVAWGVLYQVPRPCPHNPPSADRQVYGRGVDGSKAVEGGWVDDGDGGGVAGWRRVQHCRRQVAGGGGGSGGVRWGRVGRAVDRHRSQDGGSLLDVLLAQLPYTTVFDSLAGGFLPVQRATEVFVLVGVVTSQVFEPLSTLLTLVGPVLQVQRRPLLPLVVLPLLPLTLAWLLGGRFVGHGVGGVEAEMSLQAERLTVPHPAELALVRLVLHASVFVLPLPPFPLSPDSVRGSWRAVHQFVVVQSGPVRKGSHALVAGVWSLP